MEIQTNDNLNTSTTEAPPKPKRGRRTKKEIEAMKLAEEEKKALDLSNGIVYDDKPPPKKRGRKPKGGKIVELSEPKPEPENIKPNIILHLKCSTSDLDSLGNHESDFSQVNINSYSKDDPTYHIINPPKSVNNATLINEIDNSIILEENEHISAPQPVASVDTGIKELWKKLKSLEQLLHINSSPDSKSACFWCTCDFDNPPVYIPKMYLKQTYHVYGCFCSPECAVAHLMKENIDSSSKFERYSLINSIYNKIYGYKKNIKPAPNPHYMLEKFCGNLSIKEYRSLLKSDRLFLVVDKPLTRILPELHEDNDEFIINNKIIPSSGSFQVKRKSQGLQSKTTNAKENFGIFTSLQ
jgi:hypothetical protein